MHISNRDINPCYVGAVHCCKAPLWGSRLDLGSLNPTPRFAHWLLLLLLLVVVKEVLWGVFYDGLLLYSSLSSVPLHMSDRAHGLHFHAPRFIALRGGDRNEETPKTENEGGMLMLMRRACARALSPRSFLLLGAQLAAHTQPALRTGLRAPAWRLLHVSRRVTLDLFTGPPRAGRSVA